jgi:hypothetical protein
MGKSMFFFGLVSSFKVETYQTGTPLHNWGKMMKKPQDLMGKTWKNWEQLCFFVDALFHDPTGRDPSWSRAPYVIQLRMDNEGGIWCVARHIKGGSHG